MMKILSSVSAIVIILFSLNIVTAQENNDVQTEADQITQWMVENLQLTAKQHAAVKEINFEIAGLEASQKRKLDNNTEVLNKLKAILTEDQVERFLEEKDGN